MKTAQLVLIKKDLKSIATNKNIVIMLLIVPITLAVLLPIIIIFTIYNIPSNATNLQPLLSLLPQDIATAEIPKMLISLVVNSTLPMFFLIIPVMSASVMAASSFVGEKEKHTLETLLYSPLTLAQIFRAKILVALGLSQSISIISFLAMLITIQTQNYIIKNTFIPLSMNWIFVIVLISPAISIIAITLIVKGSAKAKSMEESQQRSVFLILPILLFIVAQFSGVLLVNAWMLLILGILCFIIGIVLLRKSSDKFTYERLLQ